MDRARGLVRVPQVLSVRSFKPFLREVPDFEQRLRAYVETRKRKWELDSGRNLPVGAMQQRQALEEAATTIQLQTRGWHARRTYSQIRSNEVARRGIANMQAKSSRVFVNKLDNIVAKGHSTEQAALAADGRREHAALAAEGAALLD